MNRAKQQYLWLWPNCSFQVSRATLEVLEAPWSECLQDGRTWRWR
jgi:hypothetical protein